MKVIVCGYPKSGTTWATRLVAELLDSPVMGFLYSDHQEIAVEGEHRKGKHQVYKSHHQWHELDPSDQVHSRIIYVIRDPRDIAISGIPFFFSTSETTHQNLWDALIFKLKVVYHNTFIAKDRIRRKMNKAILEGDKEVNTWCKISWEKHLHGYYNNDNVLKIKYESLLEQPDEVSKLIVKFLDIELSDRSIHSAIESQSFSRAKKRFNADQDHERANFLRKGHAEQWRTSMGPSDKRYYTKHLHRELKLLGYPLQ